jgi:hypothetical protein
VNHRLAAQRLARLRTALLMVASVLGGGPRKLQAAEPVRAVTTTVLPDPFPNVAPQALDRRAVIEAGRPGRTPSVLLGVYDVEADRLSLRSHGQPAHGHVAANADSTFTYTPNPGFTGRDAFAFTIADDRGGEAAATMHLRVVAARATGATVAFGDLRDLTAGGEPLQVGQAAVVPRLVDLDRDGRIDLLVAGSGSVVWHRGAGPGAAPAFAAAQPVLAGGEPLPLGPGRIGLAWHDLDGDGLGDLIACGQDRGIRWFPNQTRPGGPPAFAAARPIAAAGGGEFRAADIRFDVGDLDGDGVPDLVTGAGAGPVRLARGSRGPAGALVLAAAEPLLAADGSAIGGAYNLNVRLLDFDEDGTTDLIESYNWGTIQARLNAAGTGPAAPNHAPALGQPAQYTVTGPGGAAVDLHALCDGPVIDLADLDGDGVRDLVMGGERGGMVRLATGETAAASLDFVRSLLAAHPDDLGTHLAAAANKPTADRLRGSLAALFDTMVNLAGPTERRRLVDAVLELIEDCPRYLRRQSLDLARDPGIPSLAAQLWLMVLAAEPHDPAVRTRLADAAGFTGPHRALVEECGLIFIDNDRSPRGAEAIHQWVRRIPREIYPGTGITANEWLGGRTFLVRGHLKNIFAGSPEQRGEYGFGADARPLIGDRGSENWFMTVVHHEASHDLDAFVRRSPALTRRWGQLLVAAGGPEMRADPATGWLSQELTRARFREAGLWDGRDDSWKQAWTASWQKPPGSDWRAYGFMRGDIPFFYESPQESLATQGNQHWNSTEGRLQVAADRWLRGYRSNLTEVLFFIDLWSAGLDKGQFVETDDASNQVIRFVRFGRTPAGHIESIDLGDRRYAFAVDDSGVVTDIRHLPPPP